MGITISTDQQRGTVLCRPGDHKIQSSEIDLAFYLREVVKMCKSHLRYLVGFRTIEQHHDQNLDHIVGEPRYLLTPKETEVFWENSECAWDTRSLVLFGRRNELMNNGLFRFAWVMLTSTGQLIEWEEWYERVEDLPALKPYHMMWCRKLSELDLIGRIRDWSVAPEVVFFELVKAFRNTVSVKEGHLVSTRNMLYEVEGIQKRLF